MSNGLIVVPYRGSTTSDVGAFYAPYIPQVEWWCAGSEIIKTILPLVAVEGNYTANDAELVREAVEAWIAKNAKGGFVWRECGDPPYGYIAIDAVFFELEEDAMLFMMSLSRTRQPIRKD